MKNKIMANFSHALTAAMGLLTFIFLAFPYMEVFVKFKESSYSKYNEAEGYSGYKIMDFEKWEGMESEFCGTMVALLQILVLILGIAMLCYGVMALLKALGSFEQFPDQIGNMDAKKISELALVVYAALNVLSLLFLIIVTSANTDSNEMMKAGLRAGAGMYIALIFSVGAVVCLKVLPKKCPQLFENGPTVAYVCTKCGKKGKKTDKFCSACGGSVVENVIIPMEYVCSQCGKKAKKTEKFCSACGGSVVSREVVSTVRVCSQCGNPAKGNANFCSVCGGSIVEQVQNAQAEIPQSQM